MPESGTEFIRTKIMLLRNRTGKTDVQINKDLGYCDNRIQSILSGEADITLQELLELCNYFNLTPAEFFDPDIRGTKAAKYIYGEMKDMPIKELLLFIQFMKEIIYLNKANKE